MKKMFCFVLLLVIVLGAVACNKGESPQTEDKIEGKTEDKTEDSGKDSEEDSTKDNTKDNTNDGLGDNTEFVLSESGKGFLQTMCLTLPEFSGSEDMDEEFWKNFIFYGYTGEGDGSLELVEVEREDLGFKELEVKVSREDVKERARLALGVELPDYKPAFGDMNKGQTACYYQDGYYYIGVSDFPYYRYTYKECTAAEDDSILVEYKVSFEDQEDAGTITFNLRPEENANGFVIIKKTAEYNIT